MVERTEFVFAATMQFVDFPQQKQVFFCRVQTMSWRIPVIAAWNPPIVFTIGMWLLSWWAGHDWVLSSPSSWATGTCWDDHPNHFLVSLRVLASALFLLGNPFGFAKLMAWFFTTNQEIGHIMAATKNHFLKKTNIYHISLSLSFFLSLSFPLSLSLSPYIYIYDYIIIYIYIWLYSYIYIYNYIIIYIYIYTYCVAYPKHSHKQGPHHDASRRSQLAEDRSDFLFSDPGRLDGPPPSSPRCRLGMMDLPVGDDGYFP